MGLTAPAQAQEFKLTGFASLVAGRSSGGCVATEAMAPRYQQSCTRSIADWGHGAVYRDEWELDQETRAGLQGELKLNRQFSGVVQLTARTLQDQHLNLEWAYLNYSPTPESRVRHQLS